MKERLELIVSLSLLFCWLSNEVKTRCAVQVESASVSVNASV